MAEIFDLSEEVGTLSRGEVIPLLNPYLTEIVSIPEVVPVHRHDPFALLLNPHRFDMMAKYLYARHRSMGVRCNWAGEVYAQHIGAFNQFREGDYSGKQGSGSFFTTFNQILESVARKGFDEKESLVPIDGRGAVIDGAHRVAACAIHGKPVFSVVLDGYADYDYRFFLNRGLGQTCCDAMAHEYCRLEKRAFLILVYPSAVGRDREVEEVLGSYGRVFYRKDIRLNRQGSHALIRQVYAGEKWLGSWEDGFAGARDKADECFRHPEPLRVFVYRTGGIDEARLVKENIRAVFGIGNHSVHINDTEDEKLRLAGTFFNSNSIRFLNFGKPRFLRNYSDLLEHYRTWLRNSDYDPEHFCIDGSAVMSAFGIRDAADLDFLHFGHDELHSVAPLINSHNSHAEHYPEVIDGIIFDPSNHFYSDGIKFCSLDMLRRMKEKRGEGKDRHDVALIRAAQSQSRAGELLLKIWPVTKTTLGIFIRSCKGYVKKSLRLVRDLADYFRPFRRTMLYKGYRVWYTRRMSLVERIRGGRTYEAEKTGRILQELACHRNPIVLDVGANIGLMSLNILAEADRVRIFAFEPGPHQASLLRKTIEDNGLLDRIRLEMVALGDSEGVSDFHIHASMHSSGDGFLDTGRAGAADLIRVPMTTLDGWWDRAGRPSIHVIKIDTEGAELMILRGGTRLIAHCRPVLFLEINGRNLDQYPYEAEDIWDWLSRAQYRLETMSGEKVERGDLMSFMAHTEDFLALPLEE